MKRQLHVFLIFFLILFIHSVSNAQKRDGEKTVLRIGDDEISKAEFRTIYYKNNKDSNVTVEDLEDYMDLFIDFKLKVKEAEKRGLDTTQKFQREFERYKKQLARPYLIDSTTKNELLREAYRRTKTKVHASHILVRTSDSIGEEEARNRARSIKAKVLNSDSSFLSVGKKMASGTPAVQASDLGFFGAFQMVYPFENAAYGTEVGEISDPVRTSYGYHLIKVHEERPSQGRLKAAHIMKHAPKKASSKRKKKAEKEIRGLYEKLRNGEDFHELARKHSDDRRSKRKGGRLSWFEYGDMLTPFSETAFALDSNGAISEPVRTRYGWHIIKRLDHKPMESFEKMRPRLEKKLKNSDRYDRVKEATVEELKKEYDLKVKKRRLKKFARSIPDSSFIPSEWKSSEEKLAGRTLFRYDDTAHTVSALADHIGRRSTLPEEKESWAREELDSLLKDVLLSYEKARLKEKYPRYRALLQEYRDGILLFELMEEKVWNKALEDTVGLKEFYERNKSDYRWKERLDMTYIDCKERKKAEKARSRLEEGMTKKKLGERMRKKEFIGCRLDSGAFEKKEQDFLDELEWEEGISGTLEHDGRYIVAEVHEVLEPRPKELEEVRGLVSSDYQDHLEKRWVGELREEYSIEVSEELLRSIAEGERESE